VSERRFGFVQWEFAGRLGPDPGRYPVRRFAGDDVRQIVVIGGYGAPARVPRVRRSRRPKPATASPPASVDVTRATVIDAVPMEGASAAEAWLERAVGSGSADVLAGALAVLNRAVAGHRVAAADPFVADADPARALATRIGYGRGDEVAEGEWEAARALPAPEARTSRVLVPQQRLAALLSGRDVALACEELALRARLDLDAGREREGVMQAHVALETAVAELESWRGRGDMAERIDELTARRADLAAAANAAALGGLEPAGVETVREVLGRLEAALRARAARESTG